MKKIFIKNRDNKKLAVVVDESESQKGLAFVMHGLGGFKEQPHIQTIGNAFKQKGFTVVYFDVANTLGESEGDYEHATITNYYEDLEDVITWAKAQTWYQEPFALSGHSLGGICTALFAERNPNLVKALAPISPVVSGQLSIDAHDQDDPDQYKKWKETGWKEEISKSKPGVVKRLPWSHVEDRLKYDLLPEVDKLTMPVLLIVGENDTSTPPDHVKKLFDALRGPKEYHIIKGGPHTFRDENHLAEIDKIFSDWIEKSVLKA